MREAIVDKKRITAGPNSPEVATCPACGGEVHIRKRRTMDKTLTWYYRHKNGSEKWCPKRYRFGS
jgi:hypothetical protein